MNCNFFDFLLFPLPYRPYRYTFLNSNFSKLNRQNFNVNIYSDRMKLAF